jgi:hypothetical protein
MYVKMHASFPKLLDGSWQDLVLGESNYYAYWLIKPSTLHDAANDIRTTEKKTYKVKYMQMLLELHWTFNRI